MDQHHFPAYVFKRKEQMLRAQEALEFEQRAKEDRILAEFQEEREMEAQKLDRQIKEEWEQKLQSLVSKYDDKKMRKDDKKLFEEERNALARTMQEKKAQEQKTRTLRLVQKERQQTSALVAEQSTQMRELLQKQQEQLRSEIEQEISRKAADDQDIQDLLLARQLLERGKRVPPLGPPSCRKRDLYTSPDIFDALDERVFEIAEADQKTYTDLVNKLTDGCVSDLEKVRAIFRWITVKDLNVMQFDESLDKDTPLGLLRGIKYGNETYHTLFMRLCGYANVHCIEVKGNAKSVGYEPGMKIKEGQFQNSWNAVVVDGDWRLIQCNWGARHLVVDKDKNTPTKQAAREREKKRGDKIRYQYDEHYFLTDPDEFIMEFLPEEPKYQLLHKPIDMTRFIQQPFVRSVFFELDMEFDGMPNAVLECNARGGAELRLRVPQQQVGHVVFHYQLKFADKERRHLDDYKGTKLERFVYQSTSGETTVFSIHVPTTGEYYLELFANRMTDTTRVQDTDSQAQPFRLKCATKFRIVCSEMQGKMHALPNCASGEWGPAKATRHFEMQPLSHPSPIITCEDLLELRFAFRHPLAFHVRLLTNGLDEHVLNEFVSHEVQAKQLIIRAHFPQPGQYGLDLYARAADSPKAPMAHACKYMVNCSSVREPIFVPLYLSDPWTPGASGPAPDKLGATSMLQKLGMKAVSHRDPKINLYDPNKNSVKIEFLLPLQVQVTFSLRREPDEDHRTCVRLTRETSVGMARLRVTLLRPGLYVMGLFARNPSGKGNLKDWNNVFNYKIHFGAMDDASLKRRKSKQ